MTAAAPVARRRNRQRFRHRPESPRARPTTLVVVAVSALLAAACSGSSGGARPTLGLVDDEPQPPLVVFDTDLGPDIDDALALVIVHHLADLGRGELAAVTISRNSEQAVRYARAVNAIEGRGELPIGLDRQAPYRFDDATSYVSLADDLADDLAGDVPARPAVERGSGPDGAAPDAVAVLREVLAGAADEGRSVVVIQVGFSGNLDALLRSGPDDRSDLDGVELAAAADATLSIMAGSFAPLPPGADPMTAVRRPQHVEFNVAQDIEAARRLIATWPGPVLLSPWEVGGELLFPYTAIRNGLAPDHHLRRAYEFADLDWHVDAPPFYDMRTWDLTSVLAALEPERDHVPLSPAGTVTIDDEGRTTFTPGPGAHHVLDVERFGPAQRRTAVDRMIELATSG
ncbi:MAG: nucleoside hydrolase [Actinomycetota bacterium]